MLATTPLRDVAINSGIKNNSLVYFAVRKLTGSQSNRDWHWHWITRGADGAALSLKPTGTGNQFDATIIEAPPEALFLLKTESGPYLYNGVPERTFPPAAGEPQLEDQLRFTLHTPDGSLNIGRVKQGLGKPYALGVTPEPAVVWKLNWFSVATWKGILDFGMAFTNNMFSSDYPKRSTYPQSVWRAVDEDKLNVVNVDGTVDYVDINNTSNALQLVSSGAVKTQVDLGTLNFRLMLNTCVTSTPRLCSIDRTPGRGRPLFPVTNSIKPSEDYTKGESCSLDKVLACAKKELPLVTACGVAYGAASYIGMQATVGAYCADRIQNKMAPECKDCLCQILGCPDWFCAKNGCMGKVAATVQCHKDTDCDYIENIPDDGTGKVNHCRVKDPEGLNTEWQVDFCKGVGNKRCACENTDATVAELQCTVDSDCASTKNVNDLMGTALDKSNVTYAANELKSSNQCRQQVWEAYPMSGLTTQYYYGSSVCANPDVPFSSTCAGTADCAQKGGGSAMPQYKSGRDCTYFTNSEIKGSSIVKRSPQEITCMHGEDLQVYPVGHKCYVGQFANAAWTDCDSAGTGMGYCTQQYEGAEFKCAESAKVINDKYLQTNLQLGEQCTYNEQCADFDKGRGVGCTTNANGSGVKRCTYTCRSEQFVIGENPGYNVNPACYRNLENLTTNTKAKTYCGDAESEVAGCCLTDTVYPSGTDLSVDRCPEGWVAERRSFGDNNYSTCNISNYPQDRRYLCRRAQYGRNANAECVETPTGAYRTYAECVNADKRHSARTVEEGCVPDATGEYASLAQCQQGVSAAQVRFRHIKFTPLGLRGVAAPVQLAEFQVQLAGGGTARVVSASNPGGKRAAWNETAAQAVDGSLDTKWLDDNVQPLVLDLGAPLALHAYRFATANDEVGRDPVSWEVAGSLDGSAWVTLDVQRSFATPKERKTYTPWLAMSPATARGACPAGYELRMCPDGRVADELLPPGSGPCSILSSATGQKYGCCVLKNIESQ